MPITITPSITLQALHLQKLREASSDSILYTRPEHSVTHPVTVQVSSELPMPRKGNAGTVKTTVNSRATVNLDEGTALEKAVPVICKIQTSFPVGTTLAQRRLAVAGAVSALLQSDDEFDSLFYKGILIGD